MIKLYFKQAFRLLRENKLLSAISITGTALAIAMIMVLVMTLRATIAPFAPESHRDRMLIQQYVGVTEKDNPQYWNNGAMSYLTAKECFKAMTVPEAVSITATWRQTMLASQPAGESESSSVRQVDDDFWRVFQFEFLAGAPFDKAVFDAGATRAVIDESVARKLYGTTDVVGKTILLDYTAYTISGVVRPVSRLAPYAYAQVWIPFSSTSLMNTAWADGLSGSMGVLILAKSADDFPAIRAEAERLRVKFLEGFPNKELLYRDAPDTYFVASQRMSTNQYPNTKQVIQQYISVLIVLLLVPAVNLSGLTLARMRKRLSEIGIRKAFGAPRGKLMMQVLSENMLYSLLGGVVGLALSYAAAFLLGNMIFSSGFGSAGLSAADIWDMCTGVLFDPWGFVLAFVACLALNLISAFIPAWRVTRVNIVEAINDR